MNLIRKQAPFEPILIEQHILVPSETEICRIEQNDHTQTGTSRAQQPDRNKHNAAAGSYLALNQQKATEFEP